MSSTRNMCLDGTSHGRLRALKWVCLLMLLAWFGQRPHMAACSWFRKMRQRLCGRLGTGRQDGLGHDNPAFVDLAENPREWVQQRERVTRKIYEALMALRKEFIQSQAQETHSVDSTQSDVLTGQHVVEELVRWAVSKVRPLTSRIGEVPNDEESSIYSGLIKEGELVTLQSAVTGKVDQYRFCKAGLSWVLEAPSGVQYQFNLWTLEDGEPIEDSLVVGARAEVEAYLKLPTVFGVSSAAAFSRDFSVLCIRDLLTHPRGKPLLSFSGPVKAINFIPVWDAVAINLWRFSRTLDSSSDLPPTTECAVSITRLNITLQMIRIIGRATLSGVVLTRYNVSNFFLDSTGRVLFQAFNPIRRQEQLNAEWRQCSKPTCATCHRRRLARYDSNMNAQALVNAILYIWCSRIAEKVSLFTLSPSADAVLKAAMDCHSMPPEMRNIVHSVYKKGKDAGYIFFSKSYTALSERLRRLLDQSGLSRQ